MITFSAMTIIKKRAGIRFENLKVLLYHKKNKKKKIKNGECFKLDESK
jgi:hypothetical protein